MTSGTVAVDPAHRPDVTAGPGDDQPVDRGRRRFTIAVVVALVIVGVPFLWVLWDLWTGTFDPLRQFSPGNFYDLQARAMLAGHLYVPNGSLGIEAFVHGGHQYTYFGLFPSILRMPVLAVHPPSRRTADADSMLLAWLVTGLFSSLLLWRVRVLVRGDAADRPGGSGLLRDIRRPRSLVDPYSSTWPATPGSPTRTWPGAWP